MLLLLCYPFATVAMPTTPRSLHFYRAPRGAASHDWAISRSAAFRSLDELSFPPKGLWSEKQFQHELANRDSDMLAVWDDTNSLIAFACVQYVLDESHMLSLAVHPEWRGQRVARTLVLASLWAARAAGQRMLSLEVRESNEAAIALYTSCGLVCVGRRPKYYRSPPEDGLILTHEFVNDGGVLGDAAAGGTSAAPPQLEALMHECDDDTIRVIHAATTSPDGDEQGASSMDPRGLGALMGTLRR